MKVMCAGSLHAQMARSFLLRVSADHVQLTRLRKTNITAKHLRAQMFNRSCTLVNADHAQPIQEHPLILEHAVRSDVDLANKSKQMVNVRIAPTTQNHHLMEEVARKRDVHHIKDF